MTGQAMALGWRRLGRGQVQDAAASAGRGGRRTFVNGAAPATFTMGIRAHLVRADRWRGRPRGRCRTGVHVEGERPLMAPE